MYEDDVEFDDGEADYDAEQWAEGEIEEGEDPDRGADPDETDEEYARRVFANPGGNSSLRAAGPGNPRDLPCPTCKRPNMLTPADRRLGYQCDSCADQAEGPGY